uniref:LamG-like jellyroll fold domain-containing protein n=1 Tax=Globisporangium ultimum (strain ATCC 200006 / CBS 805.95 / DAOM BR144) TaxID=431595 RepID=K3WWA3_GLOUD
MLGSTTGCFSFETWFSLADTPDTFLGGILLGAQDSSIDDNSWPYIHRQVIVIDSHGNLCCSLLNTDSPTLIAKELVPNNWYHLVVTYNSNSQQLTVYLDGEMRHSASGPLHREWARLTYANIGSGCISGISPAKPSPDFAGWFGFNGLISDFKIWRALLADLEVQQLFRGATDCVDIPSYSMKRDIRKKTMTIAQNPDRR